MDDIHRIAICFYGQPRSVEAGYNNISKFIAELTKTHIVDIFVHTWWDSSLIGKSYPSSPWRHIAPDDLIIRENIIEIISELYKPIKICVESPKIFSDEILKIKKMDIYKNTPKNKQDNINNTLSNLYSKNKVADLLAEYCSETDTIYSGIISIRFDIFKPFLFDFVTHDKNKIYTLPVTGRFFLCDHLIIFTDINLFYNYSRTFNNIISINDSDICKEAARSFGIDMCVNIEELITLNLLLYYSKDHIMDTVQFCSDIPNFI
jgi:hypothetical protein